MTPLTLMLMLHYHCMADDWPNLHAPAVREELMKLLDAGLLAPVTVGSVNTRSYFTTEGGEMFIKALLQTPFPMRVWRMPSVMDQMRGASSRVIDAVSRRDLGPAD